MKSKDFLHIFLLKLQYLLRLFCTLLGDSNKDVDY